MKAYPLKQFKTYQSVEFGKHQVTYFVQDENNSVKRYLKNIKMDFVPELNSIYVRGPMGQCLVNMANVSNYVLADMTALEEGLEQISVRKKPAPTRSKRSE